MQSDTSPCVSLRDGGLGGSRKRLLTLSTAGAASHLKRAPDSSPEHSISITVTSSMAWMKVRKRTDPLSVVILPLDSAFQRSSLIVPSRIVPAVSSPMPPIGRRLLSRRWAVTSDRPASQRSRFGASL